MAVTYDQFISDFRFGSFSTLGTMKVSGALALAHKLYDETLCGDLYDELVKYETARTLWVGPNGAPASKSRLPIENPYEKTIHRLSLLVRAGPVVAS